MDSAKEEIFGDERDSEVRTNCTKGDCPLFRSFCDPGGGSFYGRLLLNSRITASISSWMWPFDANTCPPCGCHSPPSTDVTRPPASLATIAAPIVSHAFRPCSQKPSM